MAKQSWQTWLTSSLIVSSFLTTACQTTAPNGTSTTTPTGSETSGEGLKLGSLFPVTGDLASIGQNMPVAVDLAVKTVNDCGGVNGKPVTLFNQDDQTDPNAGTTAMTQLTEVNKVAGVVGSFASSVSTAALAVAVRNKVMLISPGSTSPVFTEKAKLGEYQGFWARTAPPDTYQAQALAVLAYKKGYRKVATVVINNDYGVGFEQAFVTAFEKLGGTVLHKDKPVRYDPKAATLDSEAKSAFGDKPDAVIAVLYAETGSLLLKSAYEQGLMDNVQVLLTDGVYSSDFPKQVGQTKDNKFILAGALGTVPGADGKELAKFEQFWKEKTGKEMTAYVPNSWDATALLMLSAEASKQNTGEGIKSKLQEVANAPGEEVSDLCTAMKLVREGKDINYQGASGNVDVDANGDVVGSYDVWTVKEDGSLEVIDKVMPNVEEKPSK